MTNAPLVLVSIQLISTAHFDTSSTYRLIQFLKPRAKGTMINYLTQYILYDLFIQNIAFPIIYSLFGPNVLFNYNRLSLLS